MKLALVFLVTAALLLVVSLFNPAFAQPTQVSYVVNLNSFTLQVTYPSEVMPGDNVTVNIQGSPKSNNLYLQNLTATIYYADPTGLHQLVTQNIVSNPANGYGYYESYANESYTTGSFSKNFTVNVPQNVPRTSLVAIFSETVQSQNLVLNYPSYTTTTDDAIAPLSYIKATTSEYAALQSKYQTLQQQLNQTQAQIAENKQLQTTISQQSTMISQLNQELASANGIAQTYEIVAVVFVSIAVAIIAVALTAFSIYQLRSKGKTQNRGETKASKSE
jgi:uncharacterized protein YoxC